MLIGVPKEIKTNENRIALVPAGAEALVQAGHQVMMERGAGLGSGFDDEQYTCVGATMHDVDEVWGRAEMIMKVKEPIAVEYARTRPGQVLFTYFHFAASRELTEGVRDSGCPHPFQVGGARLLAAVDDPACNVLDCTVH